MGTCRQGIRRTRRLNTGLLTRAAHRQSTPRRLYTANKYRENRMVPDAEVLQRLLSEAGFSGIDIRPSTMTIRLPEIKEFVLCHLSASPVAATVAALTDTKREALAEQVRAALHAYADTDGVAVPDETNLALAHA
jgi:hypothetical protein